MKVHNLVLSLFVFMYLISCTSDKSTTLPHGKIVSSKTIKQIFVVPRDKVICFALYTVHHKTLKLTAQLYPLKTGEDSVVRLETKQNGKWKEVARVEVIQRGWTAPLRVENWDDSKDHQYRVVHGTKAFYEGRIRKNPVDKNEIVVAAFTGNSVHPKHGGDISRQDIINNIKKINPDLLFFSGDQVYNHTKHYQYWLKFGRDFGEIIKDIPTITIPDDHDAGQPNLWGESGKVSKTHGADDGGYKMPAAYVKEVERAQTSHLPDAYDPTPIGQGIGVYYTTLNLGRISFAILEDRKFKTGPNGLIPKQGPRPDHINNPNYNPKAIDVPDAILMGKRQLKFMNHWAQDWKGSDFKVALSQTIFCGGAHIHGKIGGRLHADMDSNGWPQTGRNKAVIALRKAYAFHLAGDQHLATIFHHGVNEARDSMFSFCVPSIANLYLRWWQPLEAGKNRQPGQAPMFGDHKDGFDNFVTCYAAANPTTKTRATGDKLTTRAAGFGVVRFYKDTRKIKMICWPRNVDVSNPKAKPYPGWPMTINQQDNYGRSAIAYLPTLKFKSLKNPVVQIVDETSNEVVYTLRILGSTFKAKVFREGSYTIHVGEGKDRQTFKNIQSLKLTDKREQVLEIK